MEDAKAGPYVVSTNFEFIQNPALNRNEFWGVYTYSDGHTERVLQSFYNMPPKLRKTIPKFTRLKMHLRNKLTEWRKH